MKLTYRILIALTFSAFLLIFPASADDCNHLWKNTNESPWDSDYKSYSATLVCSVCDETTYTDFAITANTVVAPDCNTPGITKYIASAIGEDIIFQDSYTAETEILGHDYGEPQFQWSNDNTSATVTASCTRCDSTDTLTAVVDPTTTAATCFSDGITVYTASITLSETEYQEQRTVTLPQLEHYYSIQQFDWTKEPCEALYFCENCGETSAEPCTVTTQKIWNNCTDPGVQIRTASITLNGIPYTEEDITSIPAKRHSSDRILGYAATCTEDGLTDGQYCRDCGEILQEQSVIPAEGHKEILIPGIAPTCTENGYTDRIVCGICQEELLKKTPLPAAHTIEIQPAIIPTCTQPGMSEGQRCTVCGEQLLDPSPLPAHGHQYGNAVFTWYSAASVSAKRTCFHGCGTVLSGSVSLSSSSTTANGVTTTTVRASAVFPDGTTAQQTKQFQSEAPSQPSYPSQPSIPAPAVFTDVIRGSYYEAAVAWALKEDITKGTGGGQFSPDMDCSRAQIVTMLWRTAGSPKTDCATAFEDVTESAYYYHAVVWAFEKGITAGIAATTFSPDMPCTRAQIVTMLWRAAGCPKSDDPLPFTDVDPDIWYADAVAWAVENGITQGTGSGQFSPDAVCTRAQIVTFLYRAEMKN